MQTTVELPILDDTGMRTLGREKLQVTRLPGHRIQLLRTPAYVAGLARGDIVRLDSGLLCGFHVVEFGGMLGAAVAFLSIAERRRARMVATHAVGEVDAVVDGEKGPLLILSFPKALGLDRIIIFLHELCQQFPGAQWYLLNPDGPYLPTAVAARVGVRRGGRTSGCS
jgi:hypothetical protein